MLANVSGEKTFFGRYDLRVGEESTKSRKSLTLVMACLVGVNAVDKGLIVNIVVLTLLFTLLRLSKSDVVLYVLMDI